MTILLAVEPVDFRKSIEGLAMLCKTVCRIGTSEYLHALALVQDKFDVAIFTEICYPMQEEHAFDGNDQIIKIWFDLLHECIRRGFNVLRNLTCPLESRTQGAFDELEDAIQKENEITVKFSNATDRKLQNE